MGLAMDSRCFLIYAISKLASDDTIDSSAGVQYVYLCACLCMSALKMLIGMC